MLGVSRNYEAISQKAAVFMNDASKEVKLKTAAAQAAEERERAAEERERTAKETAEDRAVRHTQQDVCLYIGSSSLLHRVASSPRHAGKQ